MACVKQYSYKRQSSCSDLFVFSIYIKAFCKLQVAKAGLVKRGGGSIFSSFFIYQNRLSIDPGYSLYVLSMNPSMDPRWTLDGPSKHPRWALDRLSINS